MHDKFCQSASKSYAAVKQNKKKDCWKLVAAELEGLAVVTTCLGRDVGWGGWMDGGGD